MYVAITLRHNNEDKENFIISKNFKNVFDELGITLVPIFQTTEVDKIVDLCDALILTGSPIHVNSKLYNQEVLTEKPKYTLEDELDYLLIKKFQEQNKAILGICRGIQVLNVYFGGTLNQKIDNHEGVMHNINILKNTKLFNCYGKSTIVNSTHTQAIDKLASNFKVMAKSDDLIIEAIEDNNILGVQWHPEGLGDVKFFQFFIDNYVNKKDN